MKVTPDLLKQASAEGVLSQQQAETLWQFLQQRNSGVSTFDATHILYYLGGLLAIGALSLLITLGWERFGGWGLFFIALMYAGVGLWLTEFFLNRRQLPVPAGLMAVLVVVVTPLAIYGLQVALGFWADGRPYRDYHRMLDWRWLLMELAALTCAVVLLWRYRLAFLMMPVALTLWYMSMDLVPFLFTDMPRWEVRKFVSLWSGLLMLLLAFWVDVRSRRNPDYAFWLYVFGVIAFWGGLTLLNSDSELNKFLYLCVNLLMLVLSVLLARRVLAVFAVLGVVFYLGYLAYDVFSESLLFPLVLTLIGLGTMYLGILWQRHESAFSRRLQRHLPAPLRELLAAVHGAD